MRVWFDTDVNLDFILHRQAFYVDVKEIFIRLVSVDLSLHPFRPA